ncbi:uncharacterized protein LOC120126282 [Hibiscus syriacus]|uniref:uncharacterized protein LOC120126282 n=1 Tax=Hibiscus syriacus TaxID=106335 RepID=UPI001920FE10|nr:uncharacterized protein LOC120126282 [Hibiscus syriacus]
MDREQEELQFLGFFGILKESLKILIFANILNNQDALNYTQAGTPGYDKLSDVISFEWVSFWLFKTAYFTFLLILSLLSTSVVVYMIACIYTGKETSFKKVISVVPKVWKRLFMTFLWSFAIVFVYGIASGVVLLMPLAVLGFGGLGMSAFVLLFIPYLAGLVYVSLVWQLASVVSVRRFRDESHEEEQGVDKGLNSTRKLV